MRIVQKNVNLAIVLALTASVLLGCSGQKKEVKPSASESSIATPAKTPAAPLVTGLPDFTPLVDKIAPAVVNISTAEKVQSQSRAGMDPICQMWPDFPMCAQRNAQPQGEGREQPRGVGSGFIVSADGYILTNHHVVDGASSIVVSLNDKREFKAKVIGSDERSDVAVLKIEGENLPFLNTANSDDIKVGQWVMAAGSPFGLKNTVTAGIVSAIKRDTGEYESFIQTDAAVNPGNSGGPLVNMSGEVVGINSQILSNSGSFAGIALAIPINEALKVADQIRATGKVNRGRIGVAIGNVDEEIAKALGLPKASGAMIKTVESGSSAANAGLRAGDVVLKVDSHEVENSADFARVIGNSTPGTAFKFEVWRQGHAVSLNVTTGSDAAAKVSENSMDKGSSNGSDRAISRVDRLGLTVEPLSSSELKQAQLETGVRITKVEGLAAGAGLREGDVIVQVNNAPAENPSEFSRIIGAGTGRVLLLVQREGVMQYVVLSP